MFIPCVQIADAQRQEAGYHARINWDWEVGDCYAVKLVLLSRHGYNPASFTINSLKSVEGLNFSEGLSVSLEELRLRYFMYQPDLLLAKNGATKELLRKLEISSQLISTLIGRGFAVPRNYCWNLEVSSYQDAGLVFLSDAHLFDAYKEIGFVDALVNSFRDSDDFKLRLREMLTLELGSYFLGLANESLKALG